MFKIQRLKSLALVLFLWTFAINIKPAYAHGDLTKLSNDVGNYTIEANYDQTDLEISGSTRISFYIKDKNSENEPKFEQVYISITKDKQLLLAGPINNSGD